MSTKQILQEEAPLPEDQRLSLAHKVFPIEEPQFSKTVEHAWDIKIRHRMARYDKGESGSRSASEVFAKIDRQLQL